MRAWLLLVVGCGRVGFEAEEPEQLGDNPTALTCADYDLGSTTGEVARGETTASHDRFRGCNGFGGDVSFAWTAPTSGRYRIDLCDSDPAWDSVLSIRDGGCGGDELACADDNCGGFGLQPAITLDATAGQSVVILVDGLSPELVGAYVLHIAPQ